MSNYKFIPSEHFFPPRLFGLTSAQCSGWFSKSHHFVVWEGLHAFNAFSSFGKGCDTRSGMRAVWTRREWAGRRWSTAHLRRWVNRWRPLQKAARTAATPSCMSASSQFWPDRNPLVSLLPISATSWAPPAGILFHKNPVCMKSEL